VRAARVHQEPTPSVAVVPARPTKTAPLKRHGPPAGQSCQKVLLPPVSPAGFSPVLFVDIVRSTEKAALLGDCRWNEVLSHYFAALHRELRASRGREVTTADDGNTRHFRRQPGATRAIRCAAAIHRAVRTLGLEVKGALSCFRCAMCSQPTIAVESRFTEASTATHTGK
jgi:hypothetical protein